MNKLTVTCADYRAGQRLLGLRRRLEEKDLSAAERQEVEQEVARLERELGMD